MMFALAFPQIDPIAIEIGPIAIRWYALAYIAGLILGWRVCLRMTKLSPSKALTTQVFDDFVFWATLGVLLGGRLGYVLFYNPVFFFENPGKIFMVWQGGMSFHGGMLGVVMAIILFAWKRGLPLFALSDLIAFVAPIGLFFGRIANFINGELYGRPTDVAWGVIFPGGGPLPRHPSQLYEAGMEGLILFILLLLLVRSGSLAKPGVISGVFLAGYGLGRLIAEFFREPDAHIGFLAGGLTMGQILSLPMLVCGLGLAVWSLRQQSASAPTSAHER